MAMVELFSLSVGSNGFGAEVKYEIVKDYCEKHSLDSMDIFTLQKRMCAEVYARE
jgi:hypothetical protein